MRMWEFPADSNRSLIGLFGVRRDNSEEVVGLGVILDRCSGHYLEEIEMDLESDDVPRQVGERNGGAKFVTVEEK